MKAILMTNTGDSDVLQLADIPEPNIIQPNQLKIRLKAAGVNPVDSKIRRQGIFYSEQPEQIILGCDGAGEVVEMGRDVSQFQLGDAVWFCHGGIGREQGNYAEFTVIDSRWVAKKPANCSFIEAAAMPLVLITAWGALFNRGGLKRGETVLIHAGAGGVGHIAIQLAKLAGANVMTTVSSEEKAQFVRSLGADEVIIYRQNNWLEQLNQLTNHQGVDLVFDTIGGKVFADSIEAAAYFGRVVTLLEPEDFPLATARLKNLQIGFELMLTPMLKDLDHQRDKQLEILNQCAQWVESGELSVTVSEVLPLEQAAKAHDKIEQGHTQGKRVLEIEGHS